MATLLSRILAHPLTAGMDVDAPQTTELRRQIIRSKSFLVKLYNEWYGTIKENIPDFPGSVLELGSGAGFMKEVVPEVITSDVVPYSGIDCVLPSDGSLPFGNRTLKAMVMVDVLHHVSQSRRLLLESSRIVMPGGVMVMIEPWNTPWSHFIYRRFHNEPFCPEAKEWEFAESGPLSGANGALPWMIFERDKLIFQAEFPMWKVKKINLIMPFCYLLSGGVSLRALIPGCMFGLCRNFERALGPLGSQMAMFALIVLERKSE